MNKANGHKRSSARVRIGALLILKARTGMFLILSSAYLVLALIFTWPGIRYFNGFFFGGPHDGAESFWTIWWLKYSIIDLRQSPLFCGYFFYPDGVSLVFHNMAKVTGLLSIPLQGLFSQVIAYNVIWLLTFVISGLTAYWLARHVTGGRLPAFVAGTIFAFSPYRFGQASHMNLLPTMLIPVYALMIIRGKETLESPGGRAWPHFALAGACLGVIAYETEHYAIYLSIFSVLYTVFYLPRFFSRDRRQEWIRIAKGNLLALAVAVTMFSPMMVSAALELRSGGDFITVPTEELIAQSADLLSLFVPDMTNYYLGPKLNFISANFMNETAYIGCVGLLLAAAGFWYNRKQEQARLWLLTGLVFALLSLGPFLKLLGSDTPIPGLYLFVYKVPLLNSTRTISRFIVITSLAVAVLGGLGVGALTRGLRRLPRARLTIPVAALLLATVFFIDVRPNIPMMSFQTPAAYEQIATSDIPGSVTDIPLGWYAASAGSIGSPTLFPEAYQVVHKRPLVEGTVARAPDNLVTRGADTPVLRFLANPGSEPSGADLDPGTIARVMDDYQIAFIVIHRNYPELFCSSCEPRVFTDPVASMDPATLERLDRYITGYMGMEKFEESGSVIAYRNQR